MEETGRIKKTFKNLKAKCIYFKNYLEHIEAIAKRSSDLLFRAAQIPRDTGWSDTNIIYCIELNDKHRAIYDEMVLKHKTIFNEIDGLMGLIVDKIRIIDEEIAKCTKGKTDSLATLKEALTEHKCSWLNNNQDPWLTEFKLKQAIKHVFIEEKYADNMIMCKIHEFSDELVSCSERFKEITSKFIDFQKEMYNNLCIFEKRPIETERFYDANLNSAGYYSPLVKPDEKMKSNEFNTYEEEINDNYINSKVEGSFDTLIEGIINDIPDKSIVIKKNLEISHLFICKVKKGFAGDWVVSLILISSTGCSHILDISDLIHQYTNDKKFVKKIQTNKNLLSTLFENYKSSLNQNELKEFNQIKNNIKKNLEKHIGHIYLSFKLNEKNYVIDKKNLCIEIDSSKPSTLGMIFNNGIIKIRFFDLADAWNALSAFNKNEIEVEETYNIKSEEEEDEIEPTNMINSKPFKACTEDHNPWNE